MSTGRAQMSSAGSVWDWCAAIDQVLWGLVINIGALLLPACRQTDRHTDLKILPTPSDKVGMGNYWKALLKFVWINEYIASLFQMTKCEQHPNATCCRKADHNVTTEAADSDCPLSSCEGVIESHLHQAVKIVGCLGLIFSFTEVRRAHNHISSMLFVFSDFQIYKCISFHQFCICVPNFYCTFCYNLCLLMLLF